MGDVLRGFYLMGVCPRGAFVQGGFVLGGFCLTLSDTILSLKSKALNML